MGCAMKMDLKLHKIADFSEFIVGSLAGVASILGIITFFKNNVEGNILFSIVAPFSLSIIFVIKLFKIAKISTARLHVFADSFHKLTDIVRNEFFQLKTIHEKNELSIDYLLSTLQKTTQQSVDWLARALSLSAAREVYVTIKYFDTGSIQSTTVTDEMKVVTLCRSYNQSKERLSNDNPSKIIDNTDFYDIIKNSRAHFCTSDLEKHSKQIRATTGLSYKNSTPN